MKFKQNAVFTGGYAAFTGIMTAILAYMIAVTIPAGDMGVICYLAALLVILPAALFMHIRLEKDIVIDELGIRCLKGQKEVWAFGWDEIEQLRLGSKLRSRSIDIISDKQPIQIDLQIVQEKPDYSFQLGRSAKKALKIYGKTYVKP